MKPAEKAKPSKRSTRQAIGAKDAAWPHGKSRKAAFRNDYAAAIDSTRTASGEPDIVAAMLQMRDNVRTHPDNAARTMIEAGLQQMHLDPILRLAPELSRFVGLMREIMADFWPGMTLEQMMEPVQTVMSSYGGGRAPTKNHERIRRRHAQLSAEGDRDATKQCAEQFGLSERQINNIVSGRTKK